ncbi:MAG: helix-turn-helix transcriptional regulator [Stappiaceae bacterium]
MKPIDFECYDNLIELVYETGIDPEKWQTFCDALGAELTGGVRVMIQGHDLETRNGIGEVHANYDPHYIDLYKSHYATINPWLPHMAQQQIGCVFHDHDVLARDQLLSSEFWSDFIRPQEDISAGVGSILFQEDSRMLVMHGNISWKNQEKYRERTAELLRLLSPHVRRAFNIQRSLKGAQFERDCYSETLDRVDNAIFLVDSQCRLLHPNDIARKLLKNGALFKLKQKSTLQAHDPVAAQEISRSINAIGTADYGKLKDQIAIRSKADNSTFLSTVVPFQTVRRPASAFDALNLGAQPVAMIAVAWPGANISAIKRSLSSLYQLTPAEIVLATSLQAGQSLQQISTERNVSIHTVRNQLSSVFEKTGTRRQSELIALLSRIGS